MSASGDSAPNGSLAFIVGTIQTAPWSSVPEVWPAAEVQAAMRDHLEGCGFPYLVTDNVGQAVAWLKQHGILRDGLWRSEGQDA